jgi:chemotaxis protein MotB
VLERDGKVLAQAGDRIIRIEGHTDNVPISRRLQGRFPTNWELAAARATNVVRFLQEHAGIDPTALEAVGIGEHHPVADNATLQGRAQNRRIEIILYPRVKALVKELPAVDAPPPAAPGG